MRFLCELWTGGGPVAILPLQYVECWDGNRDYFRAISHPRNGYVDYVRLKDIDYSACIVYHESDGNYSLYYDSKNLFVLSEIYAEEGHELRNRFPSITQSMAVKAPVQLIDFGGRI